MFYFTAGTNDVAPDGATMNSMVPDRLPVAGLSYRERARSLSKRRLDGSSIPIRDETSRLGKKCIIREWTLSNFK